LGVLLKEMEIGRRVGGDVVADFEVSDVVDLVDVFY